jgi:hypothetical protein
VYRYDDGDAATSYAEVAVAADEPAAALQALRARGVDPHQLWDLGRTPCAVASDALGPEPALLAPGEVLVRRHDLDGTVTPWHPPRGDLDRRRQPRSRVATSTAQ